MPRTEGLNNLVNDIIYSYEARIQNIGSIFDTTHQIFQGFQDILLDTKQEREGISAKLKESLAKNESLRKKDFDHMMHDILLTQNEREKEVRNLLSHYLDEQREMARVLRESLERFKELLALGDLSKARQFQKIIKEILAEQDKKKEKVTSRLKEFQKEQKLLATKLKELLAKGRDLRIKDFKSMLKEFNAQHKERISCQKERKEMVGRMLETFKKQRIEAAESWRLGQKKMAQKRDKSSKIIHAVRNKDF